MHRCCKFRSFFEPFPWFWAIALAISANLSAKFSGRNADYSEEITDADGDKYTWTHVYEGTTGMLAHIYVGDSLLYNHESKTWRDPVLREHNNSREDTLKTWADMAAGIRRALSTDGEAHNNLTDAEKKTLGDHATWLESIPVKYADVNHWKIPYPDTVLPMYVDPADQ